MPQWEIRGLLVGLIKADVSGPADDATVRRVVAELPSAKLVRHEGQVCEIRFPLDAVDQAEARGVGFEMLRSAALRHLTIPSMTSVAVLPVSGTVDPRAALHSHLRSAFTHLTRVVGQFEEIRDELLAADVYFGEVGLDRRNHEVVSSEIEDLQTWSMEKMKEVLTRMAALEAGSQE